MALDFLKSLDADDIFISYSRDDGEAYLTGLDAALSNLGFSCFTDKRGTDANDDPPPTLFRKIRTCKTLVLLGTPGALRKSKNIMPEVQEFADANGTSRIIAVSFDRQTESSAPTPAANWSDTPWYEYVKGKSREREDPAALKTGEPSDFIVKSITKASDYMKSKDRLRSYRNRALVGFLCILAAGLAAGGFAFYQFRQANNAMSLAEDTRVKADATIAQAKLDTTRAVDQAQKDIQKAQEDAQKEIQKAKEDAQKEIQNLVAEKRKLAMEIQQSQDKIDATSIRLDVAAYNTWYAISLVAGPKSVLEGEGGTIAQMESKLSGKEKQLLQRLVGAERFARNIADTTVKEVKELTSVLSSLSNGERIVKLDMNPMVARTPDGREYKLEDIKAAGDRQLLKMFRKTPR